jgi:hypothetical protein
MGNSDNHELSGIAPLANETYVVSRSKQIRSELRAGCRGPAVRMGPFHPARDGEAIDGRASFVASLREELADKAAIHWVGQLRVNVTDHRSQADRNASEPL